MNQQWRAIENEHAREFKGFDHAAAVRWLSEHPGAADTSTEDGRCLFRAALTSNNYHVVKAFLEAGADVNATHDDKPGSSTMLHRVITYCQGESLRAMLEFHPDLGRYDKNLRPALYYALLPDMYIPEEEESARRNMSLTKPDDYSFAACAKQLIAAGALEARDAQGYTPLLRALLCDPFIGLSPADHVKAQEAAATDRYVKLLQSHGADLHAQGGDGKSLSNTSNKRLRKFGQALGTPLAQEMQSLSRAMEIYAPEELLQKTKRPIHLSILLGANALQPLASAQYWQRYGGAEAALDFMRQLQAFIPPHLAHLRDRFDFAELMRDTATPHADSVLAGYVRGVVGAREVGG